MNLVKNTIFLFLTVFIISCASAPVESPRNFPPEKTQYELHIDGAESGNADDQVIIGICFAEGLGVAVDYDEALEWFRKAAAKGNARAYYRIGLLYEKGHGVEQSDENALEWYYSAAASSHLPAVGKLIEYYSANEEEQLKWIEAGMKENYPYSFYRYGLVIERDNRDEAIEYFAKAKETDDIHGSALLAILSLGGRLDIYSREEAIELIEKSAELGNHRSLSFLGWLSEFGVLMKKDIAYALSLYEKASQGNNQMALYNLSRFYGEGIAVEADPGMANEFFNQLSTGEFTPTFYDLLDFAKKDGDIEQLSILYRFKASQGDLDAQYSLGMLYPPADAFQWFWMAAQEGHLPSIVELSKAYYSGSAGDRDPIQAAAWLMVAENMGYEDDAYFSAMLIEDLDDEERMDVSRIFTDLFYREDKVENADFLK